MIDDDDGDWWSVWVCVTFFLFILPPRWQTCNIWMKMYIVDFYVFFSVFFFSIGFNGFRLVFMVLHNNWLVSRFLDIFFSGLSVRSHGSGWFFMFFYGFVWISRYLVVFMVLSNNR